MSQLKKIKENIISNNNYKLLTNAYQEHAISQMNFAKYSVLLSRQFAQDLEDIFSDVKTSYKNILIEKQIKNIVKKNGKQVWILVTANKKLYGNLLIKICDLFISKVKASDPNKTDLIIIGKQGKKIFDAHIMNRPYKYYEIAEFNISLNFLSDVNKDLIYYEDVLIFYGKFNNLLSQTPVVTSIAGGQESSQKNTSQSQTSGKHNFLFEPSIQEILTFFDNQVLSLLLNQLIQESLLARFASRIQAMEYAQQNIEKQQKFLKQQMRVFKTMDINKKQLELLAGRSLWVKG